MDSKQRIHVMTLANSIIGVSILAMPFCFKQCGIVLSIVLLLFSSVLCRLACHFLLKSAIKARLRTFEFLAYHVFGSVGKLVVEIGMIGFLLGTCVAFFVVMGDLSPHIIAQVTETKSMETLRTTILVALGLLCVLPLGLLRNVDSLSSVCIATIIFYAALVFKIFLESAPQLFNTKWYEHVDFWRPSGVLQCIPIFSMALFCQTQLFEIYQAIPNASLDKMNEVVKIAVNICTSVYIFVGVFGYIAVSHKANFSGNILMDFEPSVVTETMKLGFVLSVAFSFPLIIFPCRASLYSLLYRPTYTGLHDSTNLYIPEGKFRFLTLIIVIVSLIIGILIPNIELVLGLVGSTIGIMICVIFPATCFICLTNKNTNERILAQIMLIIGIGVMVLGTYANLYAIDHIEPIPSYDKLTSNGLNVNINIKDVPLKQPERNVINVVELKNIDSVDKEMQIKIPDAVKEIRHEPVQPEEPLEPVENKVESNIIPEVKQEINIPEPILENQKKIELIPNKAEETLQEPKVKVEKKKDAPQENKEQKQPNDMSINILDVKETKDQPIEAVDSEAIKKEDQELEKVGNEKNVENFDVREKLIAEKNKLNEENKKILEEIKQQQAQKQVNVEKLIAMKHIQNVAQKAIETIVDDKINDSETLKKVEKANLAEIKNIVKQTGAKEDTTEPPPLVSNSNLKSAPLPYQFGLHETANKSIDKGVNLAGPIISKPQIVEHNIGGNVEIPVVNINLSNDGKQNPSVLDLISGVSSDKKVDVNEIKKALDIEIMKKNFTEFLINPKKAEKGEGIKQGIANNVDNKPEAVDDKKVKLKDEEQKHDENLGHRDILSKDYDQDRAKRDVPNQENCTKPSASHEET